MENRYEITKELRDESVKFLNAYANYRKCLENLENLEKNEFNEEEVNDILNLLGSFRLKEVFHLVERFKVEVSLLKTNIVEPANNPTEKPE